MNYLNGSFAMVNHRAFVLACLLMTAALPQAHAESGTEGWLRYAPLSTQATQAYAQLPHTIVALSDTPIAAHATSELVRGLRSMLGETFDTASFDSNTKAILIGTASEIAAHVPAWKTTTPLAPECFSIALNPSSPHGWIVAGGNDRGTLYGVFHLLEAIAQQKPVAADTECPSSPIRWVNQWDNLDGTIERGYAGRSIFFDQGHVRSDLTRVSQYGRLLASVGLNGATVNNVNSDLRTLEPEMIHELARIADAFRPWGVRMSLSIDLSSPQVVGHLSTFDPLDPTVAAWWKQKTAEIYQLIPDFGGFVVKADSEGRAGPSQYHRTPAEAANVL